MRRADWVAVALVGTIVVGVGSMIANAPRRAMPAVAVVIPDTAVATDSVHAKPDDSSATASLTIPTGGEVRVRLVRSTNAAPPRDVAEIQRHIRLGATGTYIDDIVSEQDSALVRWPESTVFNVWIAPTTDATEWLPEYSDTVRSAFTAWSAAGAPIGARFTTDSAAANVHVHWTDRFTDGGAIGQTLQTWDQHHWLVAGDITIAMHATTGQTLDARWVRATALHEIGHLYGLNHSSSNGDIMASEAHALDLSRADLATLRLLYALPPGPVR